MASNENRNGSEGPKVALTSTLPAKKLTRRTVACAGQMMWRRGRLGGGTVREEEEEEEEE